MAYDDLTNRQLHTQARAAINGVENLAQYAMRRLDELERRKGAKEPEPSPEPATPDESEPEPTPDPSPPPVEEPPVFAEPDEPDDLSPAEPKPLPAEQTGGWIKADTIAPLDSFSSDEEYRSHLRETTGGLRDNANDPVGAFRLDDDLNKIALMDPIFRPGLRPTHHAHGFFNNGGIDENSTIDALGQTPSHLLHSRAGIMDHSAMWIPLVYAVDRETGEYRPMVDNVRLARYYKAVPDFSKWDEIKARSPGFTAWVERLKERKPWDFEYYANTPLVALPNGLRFIIGKPNGTASIGLFSDPDGPGVDPAAKKPFEFFDELMPFLKAGQRLKVGCHSSDLWDQTHVDSPDHNSHMAHRHDGDRNGRFEEVEGFPVRLPKISLLPSYLIPEWADLTKPFALSSDLQTDARGGSTVHAEYVERWERRAKADWHEHAINGHRDCSFGNLGNGYATIGGPEPDPATLGERFPTNLPPFVANAVATPD